MYFIDDTLKEAYLDAEQEYYDYGTATINGKDVIDLHKTGVSYYDDFLSPSKSEYLKTHKNLEGHVVMMSPEEYYTACSEYGFPYSQPSVESLKANRRRDTKILDHLKNVLLKYKRRFPMPFINKADKGQEGLHRMMVIGDLYGWDHKVPVLIVDWADKQKAFEEQKRERIKKIEYNIRIAVKDALRYKFENIEDLREQLQSELDNRFEYSEDIKPPVQFELTSDEANEEFTISIGAAKYSFGYEDVQFIEPSDEDDSDEFDFELDDDFLVRYFGDNWREEFPHLKDKFHINENKNTEDVRTILNNLVKEMSSFDYAFIDADGNELDDEDAMNATVQHPNQFNKLRKGVCTDFIEYTSEKLSEHNIDHDVYFIKCVDKDGDEPSHVFVVVEDKGKFLWVEAAWHSEAGIHEYNSLEELFEDIARKHCVYDGHNYLESCEIRKVKKSLVGMSQHAIYDYVNTLPITWKAVEEGITESLQQIDYVPVSDVELFKEYADDILDGYGNMSDTDIKNAIKEIHFEGKLAGYIGFSEYEENGSKCLGIGNFMIIERGKGLGSAVIQNIVEKYKNQYDLIYCFVDAKNEGAIRLYKKLGKVYDEDSPNDNGEYYVTFWDNGRWDLDEEFDPPYNEQQVKSNYGEETYQRLIKDPAHLWRMRTGIELIHKEPSKKELERIWANWQLMSDKQKLISDKKSIQLFGKTNAENYSELIKLYESVEKENDLVFLSDKNMNGKTLTPRVPNNFLIKNGYEDSVTPRVCFASSIDKALMAISRNLTGEQLFVHQPKNINKKAIYRPSIKEVPDVKITGEIWYKEPVKLECVGKILITADDGKDGHKYTYGDKTAELYGWNWEWI